MGYILVEKKGIYIGKSFHTVATTNTVAIVIVSIRVAGIFAIVVVVVIDIDGGSSYG